MKAKEIVAETRKYSHTQLGKSSGSSHHLELDSEEGSLSGSGASFAFN